MQLNEPILSARIYLDSLKPWHAEGDYKKWVQDPLVNQYLEFRHCVPSENELKEFIQKMNAASDSLLLGIFFKSLQHLSNIKLGPIDWRNERTTLGLFIGDRKEWGKGYATESIKALTGYAFNNLNLNAVRAGCYATNIASYKAFLKSGYYEEARMKSYWRIDSGFTDNIILVCGSSLCKKTK